MLAIVGKFKFIIIKILIMENNFHYVIIGAGSAGCVLANRLSENPNNKVA